MLKLEMVPTRLCSLPPAKSIGSAPSSHRPENSTGLLTHSYSKGPGAGVRRQWRPGVEKGLQYPHPSTLEDAYETRIKRPRN